MTTITEMTAHALAVGIAAGDLSAREVTSAFLDRIEATDSKLHAWVATSPAVSLAQAAAVDEARAAGRPLPPLAGVPFGVKDIFNTADFPTEMGSPIWKGFTPGNDARVVHSLRRSGGVLLGKTATAEFAVHQLGDTVNPHDSRLNPGTSSSGSAVAVAMGQVPLALGTQTAGSIIRPASYCGIYGFKPSFGLLPRTAMLKTTDSLDTVGFLARGRDDLRLGFEVLRVRGKDFPLSDAALTDVQRQSRPADRPWRVLVARPHTWSGAHDYARDAFERELERWSATNEVELVEAALPAETRSAHEVHASIYERTLSYYFVEEAKKHQLISPVLNGMIERGRSISLDQYKAALAQQALIASRVDDMLQSYDVVATLSVAGEAPLREEPERADSCLLWTLCGIPALSVPALTGPRGLPMGIQICARRYNDLLLLSFLDFLGTRGLAPAGPNPGVA